MCKKRAHICYKGKEMEDCCNSRVEEAVAHRTYVFILIIAVALLIVSLTLKTSCNKIFVDQVSFASTVTSIILSVIAIWMSISGERGTNEIKNKVSDSVDKLIKSTSESMGVSDELRKMLDSQNLKFEKISQKVEKVIGGISEMNDSINDICGSLRELSNSTQTIQQNPDKETLKIMASNLLGAFNGQNGEQAKELAIKGINFLYDEVKENKDTHPSELIEFLKNHTSERNAVMMAGMITTLSVNGLFKTVDRKELNI